MTDDTQGAAPAAAATDAPKVSLGRIVHVNIPEHHLFKDGYVVTQAALVTGVNADGSVNLHVFLDQHGSLDLANVKELDPAATVAEGETAPNGWFWPPKV